MEVIKDSKLTINPRDFDIASFADKLVHILINLKDYIFNRTDTVFIFVSMVTEVLC